MNFLHQIVHPLSQAVKQHLRQWTQPDNHTLALNAALDLTRTKLELMLENALLRQQLIVLKRQTKRPKLTWRDRTLFVLLASKLRTWKEALIIVQPDTVLRWHRELFKHFWKRKSNSKQKQGRPPLKDNLVALIKQIVKENLTGGAERIRGELLKLGIRVSKRTIQKYMKDVRQSSRSPKQTWEPSCATTPARSGPAISSKPMMSSSARCSCLSSSSWARDAWSILVSPGTQRISGLPSNCEKQHRLAKDRDS